MDKITAKLKSKAVQAKTKIQTKKEKERHCDNNVSRVKREEYEITELYPFLSNFLLRNTLNSTSTGRVNKKIMIEVRNQDWVLQNSKHVHLKIDKDWLKAQDDYVKSLSTEDLFNIYGYTHKGDVYVNHYLRGSLDIKQFMSDIQEFAQLASEYDYFPLFFPALRVVARYSFQQLDILFQTPPMQKDKVTLSRLNHNNVSNTMKYEFLSSIADMLSFDRFWVSVLEEYVQCLDKIIRNAPPTTEHMILYRGVTTDYYLTKFMMDHRDRIHVANSFVSTSSSITQATDFVDFDTSCCFTRIYVPKGTRMILMAGISKYDEAEFLLNHRTQLYITKSGTEDFCKDSTHKFRMRVTDVVTI
jgi:hypothetical protein